MNIIPVIDLKGGLVVSAKQGNRNTYQPIKLPVSRSSQVEDILQFFLAVYPFKIIYIADLDAIAGTGSNQPLIDSVISNNPTLEFWLDNGKKIADVSTPSAGWCKRIIGSECQNSDNAKAMLWNAQNNILSLDFFPKKGYRGPKELLENDALWPANIIIMSLAKVGSNAGPDLNRLRIFCQKYPAKNIIAAGGIRHANDLLRLKKIGVSHTLIASALHSGAISSDVINKLQTKKYP